MDRRRAAGALFALAACLATSHAAPTATSNQTALDLYDEVSEGCYYNFQHYGEGDRIMTNEPCLNCTCHNRMLMCYLRVCPFTKAIGQDCTVEKRADQCCPIVTCPDVPVDLLTSTSTSSPAEYGGTGVGKIDKYGCTINGKYFPEGAKVPPTPNKPCEHCYCIRNMTTCVMQECTLHVDGCTPIYHKDVCCPVRYFCDHPEDEMLLLDDMTTTVRPTPGFLLTTIAPVEATEAPDSTTLPARRDCVDGDQLYPDGALIKTDKPCQHCYCMKGDIVCVVQECGTPMENEGKNCTSLPPREGQCCPDTYICEGDEPSTALPFEEVVTTTILPPRRVSVEGSGYRNEDEVPYTEAPTFATELEGSGEEDLTEKPVKIIIEGEQGDKFGPTDESEFIPKTTASSIRDESEKGTTEPDKDLNTVPSEDEESEKPSAQEMSTSRSEIPVTEPSRRAEYETTPSVIAEKEQESSEPALPVDTVTSQYEIKETEPSITEEPTTPSRSTVEQSSEPSIKETTSQENLRATESYPTTEGESGKPEEIPMTAPSIIATPSTSETSQPTEHPIDIEKENLTEKQESSTESAITTSSTSAEIQGTTLSVEELPQTVYTRRTMPPGEYLTTSKGIEEEKTESSLTELTTEREKLDVTEHAISEQNTVPIGVDQEKSSEPTLLEKTTSKDEIQSTESPSLVEQQTEPIIMEKTTSRIDVETTKTPVKEEAENEFQPATIENEIPLVTTESVIKETETTTSVAQEITKEIEPEDKKPVTVLPTAAGDEIQTTTKQPSQEPEDEKTTIGPIIELSTFAQVSEKESATTSAPESETASSATEKIELPETTTVDEADNEIPPPGRIPGEGDCLLEGVTYKNDSILPSTNKCHTGCKCVSSIIKCDPIICSSPPEDMDNCQPRYDTPESCCPTYICDHGMETIPPQPQSHITGTESPMSSPAVECVGDLCNVSEDKKEPTAPSETVDKVGASECDNEGCKLPVHVPVEGCSDSKCELPSTLGESHPTPTEEVSQKTPINEAPQSCDHPEDCKERVPAPCEGDSCSGGVQSQLCDIEKGCNVEPEIPPPKIIPELCGSDGECKPVSAPVPTVSCEGKSCSTDKEDCSTGKCPSVSSPAEPSQQEEICSEDSGCKKPQEPAECDNGSCVDKDLTNKFGCTGDECMQQQPLSPTQETSVSGPVTTAASEPGKEAETSSPEIQSTLAEEVTTGTPDKDIKEQERPISEESTQTPQQTMTVKMSEIPTQDITEESTEQEQKLTEASVTRILEERTTLPYRESEFESTSTEMTSQDKTEVNLLEKVTERPTVSAESLPTDEEQIPSTGLSMPEHEIPQHTTLPETKETEEATKAPEIIESEGERTTVLPEKESEKPEIAAPTAEIPSTATEMTTPKSVSDEEIITESSVAPVSESREPIPQDHKENVDQFTTESLEALRPESSTSALDTTVEPKLPERTGPEDKLTEISEHEGLEHPSTEQGAVQPQLTEGSLSESTSTISPKATQAAGIIDDKGTTTPSETKETMLPYWLVTKQAEDTTQTPTSGFDETGTTLSETHTTKLDTPVSEDETKLETLEPYKPQQTTEVTAPLSLETESSVPTTEKETSTEKESETEKEKTPTTEKQHLEPGIVEPTVTEQFEEQPEVVTQTAPVSEVIQEKTTEKPHETEFEKTTALPESHVKEQEPERATTESSVIEKVEISSEKPEIVDKVSPTEETELKTKEPEIMHTDKPLTVTQPTFDEISTTEKPEQESTKAQGELITQEYITKSPVSHETLQPEDFTGEGQLSTHEPQRSSTEPSRTEEFDTKQPEIAPTEESKTTRMPDKIQEEDQTELPILREPSVPEKSEASTEPGEVGISPESGQDAETEQPHMMEPFSAPTELPHVTATSTPEQSTQAIPELSVTEHKDLVEIEHLQTESVPSDLPVTTEAVSTIPPIEEKMPEQLTETPRPEIETTKSELEQEPTQTSRPADEQEESEHTSRPVSEQEVPAPSSSPTEEQEEYEHTSRPVSEQEESAQTTTPEVEQEETAQTSSPTIQEEQTAQTTKPEIAQEEPAQTSRPESEQEELAPTSRPEGEIEEHTQTSKPSVGEEETAQTSGPENEQEEPVQTSRPDVGQEQPTQTSRPEGEQEEPAQTTKPVVEQEVSAQTSRPESEQVEAVQTSTPESEKEESLQTSRPEGEHEESTQTSKPQSEQEEPVQTPKPAGEYEESAQTSRPESEQEEPAQTSTPESEHEEPSQTSRPEGEQEESTQTFKPQSEQEEPVQTSTPVGEHEESAQTSKPEGEEQESTETTRPAVEQEKPAQTIRPVVEQKEPAQTTRPAVEQEEGEHTSKPESEQEEPMQTSTVKPEFASEDSAQTLRPESEPSETTPYLIELEEHTHKMDVEPTIQPSQEPTTSRMEPAATEQTPIESSPSEQLKPEKETKIPYDHKEEVPVATEEPQITTVAQEQPDMSSEPSLVDKFGPEEDNKEALGTTPKQPVEVETSTTTPSAQTEKVETEKPLSSQEMPTEFGQEATVKPLFVPFETTAPEEEFIPVTSKVTTAKVEEETPTQPPSAKPEEKPSDMLPPTATPDSVKPDEHPPVDEDFPPSGGYNQEPESDYADEDQAFGPGTCRYGGKVYVSAQQIPRDDPCDFCFCFRSDIICLQQSCPPPIHGCHEEPIQGFCCPRYECPVSMATTLNVTTTTTTTTTTLPPHFLPHAYKGAAQRKGCQIKGHTYQVGEVVRASSGPCLHCTCGGDGQMKCDPKACTPEPMLRQMIAAAVSAKRRR